ncbi:DNA segregation ATPase FtsK/SpoIIIE [Nostoc flagelliforme CCNUN1]|uniref:DNA segregation ATPase FtsK/SpoIIIE n=1 Tax=Nostoc flagelliforme CCNUN1 TaxID=2038116 RepID=A0A2K8SI01_9NOSO|nr:DNA segregation ATPase FtsK/SpoIIIE [Nostoc flagelliforme CCNUN1]
MTFGKFDGLPHLVAPVARDAESTANLLDYLVEEMELRYQEFERHNSIETIAQYNLRFAPDFVMPRVICLIDECFDLLSDDNYSKDIGKSKAAAVTKTKQHKTDFEGSFNFKVQLDEEARNSILNLHQKGYQLDEIVKAVFNLSRQDGRSYKKFRNVVEEFLNSLKGGEEDDI